MFPDLNGWEREDYVQLVKSAAKGSFQPEHWLAFCTIESGLVKMPGKGPYAQNPYAPAKGLWQAMPNILANLGFKPGNPDYDAAQGDFKSVPITGQIRWSFAYLTDWKNRYRLGNWSRAGDLYLCNFAPAHLPHKNDPEHVIFDSKKSPETYWVNRGLDCKQAGHVSITLAPPKRYLKDPLYTGKGYINVRDMEIQTSRATTFGVYKQAVRSLNELLQSCLNVRGHGADPKSGANLVEDGLVGQKTLAALERFWNAANFPKEDRVLDAFTRASLL